MIALTAVALTTFTMVSGGKRRSYELYDPPHRTAHPALVLVLHGGGSTAEGMRRYVKFERASGNGAVVIYPQGVRNHWNDARGSYPGAEDLTFLHDLVVHAERTYHTDPRRVFLTGISNGGVMSLTAACEMREVTAVAVVAANLPVSLQDSCKPAHPVSVLVINGTDDPINPFNGGEVHVLGQRQGAVLSSSATIAAFRAIDGCTQTFTTKRTAASNGDTFTAFQRWDDCAQGSTVELASVQGGGHAWPGAAQYLPQALIGIASQSFDATAAIWAFFKAATISATAM
jgi:polyhydroxybutyrate depolymerase